MHAFLAFACLISVAFPVASLGIFPAQRKQIENQKRQVLAQKAATTVLATVTATTVVVIPDPVDVGGDGFPALPEVTQIMGQSSQTLKTVSSGASSIVGRMVAAQEQSQAELGRQKHAFEGQLKVQEMKNQAVADQTKKITSDIESLKQGNVQLRMQAHEILKKNNVLRSVVRSLEAKMSLAKEFTAKSMTETDDSNKPELKVLEGGKGPDDDFLRDDRPVVEDDEEEDEDSTEEGTSLLAISSKVVQAAATKQGTVVSKSVDSDLEATLSGMGLSQQMASSESPDSILKALSKDVETLVHQRKQSASNLKNLFIRDYRAGAKRHLALLNQQKVLKTEMEGLEGLQLKLKEAVEHLQGTHSQLGRKLHSLGQFLQKLAHVANAPELEVPNLLHNLPKAVNIVSKTVI